jgi:hypothetical protein
VFALLGGAIPEVWHEVLLPPGAAEQFRQSAVLWNTPEMAEKRRDTD